MAEHSMCQPGRPGPQRDSHAGSSSRDGCHKTKSNGSRLFRSSGSPAVKCRQLQHDDAVLVTDLTETGEFGDFEVDRAVHLVGDARLEGAPDHGEDLRDRPRRSRFAVDREQVDQLHIAFELGHLLGGEVQVVDAQLSSLAQHVVVDVGDISHAAGLVAGVAKTSLQDIETEIDVGVTEVGRVIGRDAAAVDGDERTGLEGVHAAARGVVELHRVKFRPSSRSCAPCGGC